MSESLVCDNCGRKPILQRQPSGVTRAPSFVHICVCGERGINGPTRESARYGWKRRREVREARAYLRSKVGVGPVDSLARAEQVVADVKRVSEVMPTPLLVEDMAQAKRKWTDPHDTPAREFGVYPA